MWLVAVTFTEHVQIDCTVFPPRDTTTFFSFPKDLSLSVDLVNGGT